MRFRRTRQTHAAAVLYYIRSILLCLYTTWCRTSREGQRRHAPQRVSMKLQCTFYYKKAHGNIGHGEDGHAGTYRMPHWRLLYNCTTWAANRYRPNCRSRVCVFYKMIRDESRLLAKATNRLLKIHLRLRGISYHLPCIDLESS